MPTGNINNKQTIVAILNKVISKTLTKSYPEQTPLLQEFTKNKSGVRFDFDNDTIQFDMNSQALPPAGTGQQSQMVARELFLNSFTVSAVPQYVSAQVPKFTQALARNDKGAIARLTPLIIDGFREGFKLKFNKMLNGAGDGVLAQTSSTQSTPSKSMAVVLDSGLTISSDRAGATYFVQPMAITIAGGAGGSLYGGTGTVVTSVNYSTNTLTLQDAMTWTSGSNIYEIGPDGGIVTDISGCGQLIASSGTIQGQNIALLPNQQSLFYTTAGAFNGNIIAHLWNSIRFGKPDFISSNITGYNKVGDSYIGQQRTGMGKKGYLDAGYPAITIMGGATNLVLDYDMPTQKIRGINTKYWKWGTMQEMGPMDPTISIRIPTYPVSEFAMQWSGNVGCTLLSSSFEYNGWT